MTMRITHDGSAPLRAHGSLRVFKMCSSLTKMIKNGIARVVLKKGAACARYERRHARLAGPKPGAKLG